MVVGVVGSNNPLLVKILLLWVGKVVDIVSNDADKEGKVDNDNVAAQSILLRQPKSLFVA